MYFFMKRGKQYLDLRGNLILSHNDAIIKGRFPSAAPTAAKNVKYIINLAKPWGFWYRLRATFAAIRFIWGPNEALTAEDRQQISVNY